MCLEGHIFFHMVVTFRRELLKITTALKLKVPLHERMRSRDMDCTFTILLKPIFNISILQQDVFLINHNK